MSGGGGQQGGAAPAQGGQGGGMPQISPQSYTDLQNVFQYFQNNRGNAGGQTPMSNVAAPGGGGGLQTNTAPPASHPPAPPPPPAAPNPDMSGFNPMMRAPRQQQLSPRLQQLASQGQLNMFQPQIQPQGQPQPVQAQPQEGNTMGFPTVDDGPYGWGNAPGRHPQNNAPPPVLNAPPADPYSFKADPNLLMVDSNEQEIKHDDQRFIDHMNRVNSTPDYNAGMPATPETMNQPPMSVGALTTQGGGIQRPDMSQVGGFAGPNEQQQPTPMSRKTLIPSMGRGVQIQGNPTAQPFTRKSRAAQQQR